ncbi:MAG TPA: universal stress protein [Pyrinomonadaceae bacterium]|nr:universal stress protein [Pyrinomonadaceae bacterium]
MKILIATDGSDFSKVAVDQSCRMAIRPNDEVLIVSSYEDAYPVSAEPFALSAEYYQKMEDAMNELAEGFTADARKSIEETLPNANLTISTEVLRGSPQQRIVERAEEWAADLIVVGSHGRGFWGRLLGSVSNSVVHHAPCSVLIVRKPKDQ